MIMYLLAAVVAVLCVLVAVLFVLRYRDNNAFYDYKINVEIALNGRDERFVALSKILHSQENKISELREEIQTLKIQRDELEREERKVLDGMNNIVNYGFDVARKAARDGGEG